MNFDSLTMDFYTLFAFGAASLGIVAFVAQARSTRKDPEKDRSYAPGPGERMAHLWGYQDTRFEFCGPSTVHVTGSRYPLAGPPLPKFIPFVEEVFGLPLTPEMLREPTPPATLPPPVENAEFSAALASVLRPEQLTAEDQQRLIHSHGQLSVEEIYRILGGTAPPRIVDLVVFPDSAQDVVEIVRLADAHGAALIPYGGGTNVSGALLCPVGEKRMIVSVDMRRMSRLLTVDRQNHMITVESGITGKALEAELELHGLTCGHVPDSMEFSTLGGWIATHASGMKKNRYGNIEDIVLEATLVTPRGEIRTLQVNPRCSIGVNAGSILFGSEGSLGIITQATLKVHPLPEERRFASFVFKDFAAGLAFLKEVQNSGARPASLRLANKTEFRLGRALSPAGTRWHSISNRLKQFYVVDLKGFDPLSMVVCTAVMEGAAAEVRQQQATLSQLCKSAGGLPGGPEAGKRGYRVTFAIAYIRDFLNKLGVLGETFETSAPWDRIEAITQAVESELQRLCKVHQVPGNPYLSYRISQIYQSGVCIYFTMGFSGRGMENPEESYHAIEHRLREVILERGGSLSHHHGVGKVRRDFLPQVHSEGSLAAAQAVKQALDPGNVFAAGNNIFGLEPRASPRQQPGHSPVHPAP
jgi:alkyldihydroxyacetonephosphate synthase